MLSAIRYFFSDLGHWLSRHRLASVLVIVAVLAAGGVAAYLLSAGDQTEQQIAAQAPAPRIVVEAPTQTSADTQDLGFPAFATKNTTRVGGADPVADAAGVALAVDPSTGGIPGPDAVTLVDAGEWQGGIAAASLVADPVGAPVLITESGHLPAVTSAALRSLDPQGSAATAGRQVFVVGAAANPEGFEALELKGNDPAELAVQIDRLRERLAGKPDHVLVASSDEPAYAMPAAGWAARSGDPVLFVDRAGVPDATRKALSDHRQTPVYVLGPRSAISAKTFVEIEKLAPGARRVGADGPVENAIAFARFADGSFGWNINDPGHGFVIANVDRPLDAAAAAPLSASGTWGPLLLTDDGGALPAALRGYLLDLKPGYVDDPTRAVYNHLWLIGDTSALSVALQSQADDLAEVAPVTSGSGAGSVVPPSGASESRPAPNPQKPEDQSANQP